MNGITAMVSSFASPSAFAVASSISSPAFASTLPVDDFTSSVGMRFSSWRLKFFEISCCTTRYGVSMNPKSLTTPKVASEPIRPMFGPSGVSIGQMRP